MSSSIYDGIVDYNWSLIQTMQYIMDEQGSQEQCEKYQLLGDENSISYCEGLECGSIVSFLHWAGSAQYIVLLFSFPRQRDFFLGKIHNPNLLYPQYNTWKKKLFINLCCYEIRGFKSLLLSGHMQALGRRTSRGTLFSNNPMGCFQVTAAECFLDWISERFV